MLTVNNVLTDENIDRIADAIIELQSKENTTLPAMQKQLKDCEKSIDNLLNAIQAGILTCSTKERVEQLEKQRDDMKLAIMQAQLQKPTYTKEQIVQWISRFKYGSIDDEGYRKEIINTFLNSVYVYDDKLVFTYNYRDGTETLTLKEIEAAFSSDLKNLAPPKEKPPVRVAFLLACPRADSMGAVVNDLPVAGQSRDPARPQAGESATLHQNP
jgi:hypothetical protein